MLAFAGLLRGDLWGKVILTRFLRTSASDSNINSINSAALLPGVLKFPLLRPEAHVVWNPCALY